MKKLTEGDVERLLHEAADWEPTAPPPPMILPERHQRRTSTRGFALGLSTLAAASVAVAWQLRPTPAPTVHSSPPVPVSTDVPIEPNRPQPPMETTKVKLASVPSVPFRREARRDSITEDAPEPRRSRKTRRPRSRHKNWIGAPKRQSPSEEFAPYRYVRTSEPLPKDAICLDSPTRVVPIVITNRDEKTGDIQLVAGATIVGETPNTSYSLE